MNREDYQKAKEIFQSALDTAPAERAAFLEQACAGNEDLRREVERLLDAVDSQFMETPAVAGLADMVAEEKTDEEPTQILTDEENEETKILAETEPEESPNPNHLRPSRLRYTLVLLVIAIATAFVLSNFYLLWWQAPVRMWRVSNERNANGYHTISATQVEDLLKGDEILSVNGTPFDLKDFLVTERGFKQGEHYTLELRRDEQLLSVEIVVPFLPTETIFKFYFVGLLVTFLYLGGAIVFFLLRPNDKAVLLVVVASCMAACIIPPAPSYYRLNQMLPQSVMYIYLGIRIAGMAAAAVTLHFFLIFPKRLGIVRRFPSVEYLLYLPCVVFLYLPMGLVYLLPNSMQMGVAWDRFLETIVAGIAYGIYTAACLTAMIFNYLAANKTDRRRLNVLAAGFLLSFVPTMVSFFILAPFNIRGGWTSFFIALMPGVIPLAFSYAIIRHKVFPVSLVVRRGLQYLLAKNALRLLFVLPVLGIVWNIAANPNRTLSEILLQNSTGFYLFIILAIALVLINRYGLREWIDRRFFREQYQQEKVLRDLTETVAESDSLTALSRLVSSKIQAALHPENVYLFFRDDAHQSDFSLGYSTSTDSGTSADLKLAADSPLLRFMQQQRNAIDFPFRDEGDLPPREGAWLRSIDASLLVPMFGTDRKLAGFFSLGEKKSEIPYTGRDKELLETLAQQIALVHENLSLKDRMRHEQRIKTEVLSRFDEGNINLLKECPKCGRCYDRNDENCSEDSSELTFSLPVERTVENRYRLERLLGKGGMGAVYETTDMRIGRRVAVKILSGAMFGNKDALRRFEREAQTAGRLQHHNIVTIFDYGVLSTEGAFLVMELVGGESLREVLKRKNKLDTATISGWFSQVLDGVESAHKAGVVHRDLKPENIFVSANESGETRLCILDFGLARLSETEIAAGNVTVPGTVIGTFGYMPPEQLRGEKVDERTDLFAVAVMIYEALHGAKPFTGKSYHELLTVMSQGIEFDADMHLPTFFERGLANKPEDRFASASEMKNNLIGAISAL